MPSSTINYSNQIFMVTGAAGFIGSHLTDHLIQQGATVIGIDNLSFGSESNLPRNSANLKFHKIDINNRPDISECLKEYKPSAVFHLAANASVPLSEKEPAMDFEANASGTVSMLESIRLTDPAIKLVLASSAAVYGEPGTTKITEETRINPISHYGLSKHIAELECHKFHKSYGIPVVIARLFNCYGPRMPRFVILDFLKKLQSNPGELQILGSGQQTRDFTFVSDTVRGLIACAEHGQVGQAYNIASGTSSSISELAVLLLQELGLNKSAKISYTGESWPGDAQFWSVSVQKAAGINYNPEVSLQQGLKQVIAWYKLTNNWNIS